MKNGPAFLDRLHHGDAFDVLGFDLEGVFVQDDKIGELSGFESPLGFFLFDLICRHGRDSTQGDIGGNTFVRPKDRAVPPTTFQLRRLALVLIDDMVRDNLWDHAASG